MSRQMRSKAIVIRGNYHRQSRSLASGLHVSILPLFFLFSSIALFILLKTLLGRLGLGQNVNVLFAFLLLEAVWVFLIALLSGRTPSRGGFGRTGLAFGGRSSG